MGKKKIYVGDQISKWFENKVREQTYAVLKKKNEAFFAEHNRDSEDELISYVKQCAAELGHTPNPDEIVGGKLISERFGGWKNMLAAANLSEPTGLKKRVCRSLYEKEYNRQMRLAHHRTNASKKEKSERREQRTAEARLVKDIRTEQDMAWGARHEADTDEQLLEYVRKTAARLGHTPFSKEVPGAKYISQRFGGWAVVLTLAELPLPKDVKPPKPEQLERYYAQE